MKTKSTIPFKFMGPQNLLFFLILHTLVFAACSPQRRLERLVSRHAELRIADTIKVNDSLIIPAISADTAIPLIRLSDTACIRNDRLEIALIRIRDTIHVTGRCKADTIIRTLRIPVERIKLVKAETGWLSKLPWIILGLLVIAIVIGFRLHVSSSKN